MNKICAKCGETKLLSEYHNHRASKDGKKSACRACANLAAEKWRQKNAEQVSAYRKRYREENKEAVLARTKRWREQNVEHLRAYDKRRREEDPERHAGYLQRWREENREHCLEYSKRWKQENPEKAQEHRLQWTTKNRAWLLYCRRRWWDENRDRLNAERNKWREENREHTQAYQRGWYHKAKHRESVKVRRALRAILRHFLESAKLGKTGKTHELLGYTAEDLRNHIERQFVKGMSWDNHGEWHIDHIISLAEHVRNGETNPAVVNCLTNLRPLWAKDNIRKSAKRMHLL